MILERILQAKRREVVCRKSEIAVGELKSRMWDAPPPLDFAKRLVRDSGGIPAVIAEIKRASPSKGSIRPNLDPAQTAISYEASGAAAVSVLTDEQFFRGSLQDLKAIKESVRIPVLRKDFILDEYQVYESRAAGADAILLIAAALDQETLKRLMNLASEIGLQYIVEVHNESELQTAIEVGAPIIGINNRDLRTFEVSLDVTARLLPMIPRARKISESGISSRHDLEYLGSLGADAVLIGEALMVHADPAEKLRELLSP
ncbi:MAG: indole-3-glycerol phosphate synthase TrpC [Armatimonadota bacterium]|nr:indole-3-glycerol phosphate synthase TrpC [Armatimonadota bacterium]